VCGLREFPSTISKYCVGERVLLYVEMTGGWGPLTASRWELVTKDSGRIKGLGLSESPPQSPGTNDQWCTYLPLLMKSPERSVYMGTQIAEYLEVPGE
jgi:hypothetical protein